MLAALLRLKFQAAVLVLLALAALTFLSYVKVGHVVFCSHSRYLRSAKIRKLLFAGFLIKSK